MTDDLATGRRLFSEEELTELARAPRDRIARHLIATDVAGAVAVMDRMERELHGQLDRYTHWIASLFTFLREQDPPHGSARAVHATRRLLALHPAMAAAQADLPVSLTTIIDATAADDPFGTLLRVDEVLLRWRELIDLHRDWISALLTDIYRHDGADALEAAHRYVGQRTMASLTANLDGAPQDRLEVFVWLLLGHFSELTVTEEPDRFVIEQHPCGTCGRQAEQGRHAPPLDLAVVDEDHLVTWGGRPTTIYRTHVPVWHVAMAREQIGVAWPVNGCPAGADGGDCQILLYKDPLDPAADEHVPGSLRHRPPTSTTPDPAPRTDRNVP